MRTVSLAPLFALSLLACGGLVDAPADEAPLPAPPRTQEGEATPAPELPRGPERVADGVGRPSALGLAQDRVVFTTRATVVEGQMVDAGGLFVSDKRTGPALLVALDRQGASFDALALDDERAYVATSDGRLLGVPLFGGAETVLAELAEPAVALATSGDHVYFATGSGALARAPKVAGTVEPVGSAGAPVRSLLVDGSSVLAATAGDDGVGAVVRVEIGTGASEVLSSAGAPCAMVKDGRQLYWTTAKDAASGAILSLSLEDGAVTTVAKGAFAACAIAADGQSLWFATTSTARSPGSLETASLEAAGDGLMRAPAGGGDPVHVAGAARVLAHPGAIAADERHVYWMTESAVLRLRK